MRFVTCSKYILCALAISFTATSHSVKSAEAPQAADKNASTQQATQALKTHLAELTSYRGKFTQTITDAQGVLLQESHGVMSLQKPNQLRWEVNFPDDSLFVADGEVIYNLDPFVEQVTLMSQAGLVESNPLMLLISDEQSAWDNVLISVAEGNDKDKLENNSEGLETYLVSSKSLNSSTQLLTLTFKSGILQSLKSIDKQGQLSQITFSDIEQNGLIAASAFRVDVPDTYVVDDQR